MGADVSCLDDPRTKGPGLGQSRLPVCCESVMNEVFLEVSCGENTLDEDGPVAAVSSKWMQKPVIAAFEARLAALEREQQAAIALEAKLAALDREKHAAIAREDYGTAKRCKEDSDKLKGIPIVSEGLLQEFAPEGIGRSLTLSCPPSPTRRGPPSPSKGKCIGRHSVGSAAVKGGKTRRKQWKTSFAPDTWVPAVTPLERWTTRPSQTWKRGAGIAHATPSINSKLRMA